MGGENLNAAKKAKNDEFYTRLEDIEKEVLHEDYALWLNGKIVYCNCDDPEKSRFPLFFKSHFKELGLKGLIVSGLQGASYTEEREGRLLTFTFPLEGTGDFRSPECVELLKRSDVVITNPPFSLFREYLALLIKYEKKFLIVGNKNAVSCKNIFPLFREGKIRFGFNSVKEFDTPDGPRSFGNIGWYTNLDINKQKTEIPLCKHYKGNEGRYPKYDNYDAIEVSKVKDIPKDYDGAMGVPVTFLDHYDPEQFRIVGSSGELAVPVMIDGKKKTGRFYLNGKRLYDRIIIQKKERKRRKVKYFDSIFIYSLRLPDGVAFC